MPELQPPAVYLASPLGFSVPGRHWYEQVLVPAVRDHGLGVLDPWTNGHILEAALELPRGDERDRALRVASREVATRNLAMIRASEAVIAVLDGSDVDSGTSAEMGFALALDIPVFGLRTDTRQSGDHELGIVNLQVEECVYASGGVIESDLEVLLPAVAERIAIRRTTASSRRPNPAAVVMSAPPPMRRTEPTPPPAWLLDEASARTASTVRTASTNRNGAHHHQVLAAVDAEDASPEREPVLIGSADTDGAVADAAVNDSVVNGGARTGRFTRVGAPPA